MYSTKNYIQSPGINNNGKECVKNEHIYVYNRVTLLYSRNWHNIINQLCCCCCSLIIKLCPALCDPMDCIPQALLCIGFILQARIQEWIAISFSRESSCPGDWTHISCTASGFFTIWAREANQPHFNLKKKKREFLKSESCESLQEPDLNPRVSPYYLRLYKQGTITFPSSIILLEGGRTTVALTLQRHGVPCEMASHTPHFCLRT